MCSLGQGLMSGYGKRGADRWEGSCFISPVWKEGPAKRWKATVSPGDSLSLLPWLSWSISSRPHSHVFACSRWLVNYWRTHARTHQCWSVTPEGQVRLAPSRLLGMEGTGGWGRTRLVLLHPISSMALNTFQRLASPRDRKRWLTGMFPANLHICKVIWLGTDFFACQAFPCYSWHAMYNFTFFLSICSYNLLHQLSRKWISETMTNGTGNGFVCRGRGTLSIFPSMGMTVSEPCWKGEKMHVGFEE